MSPRSSLVAAAATLAFAACAPATEHARQARPAADRATLVVQNANWLEVAVYLVRGTQRVRLGSVPSMSKGEFAIPGAYIIGVSDVTLQAAAIGSHDSYTSPPIQVFPGARLALKVENQLRLSNFAVYATD